MSDRKIEFGTASQSITCTINSLANGSARESTAIDNTTNKYLDAMVYLAFAMANTSPGSDKRINIWFYCSEDGTNYSDNATGSDAALTMRTLPNLFGPFIINTPTQNITYKHVIPSVAEYFGGILPPKWGIVVENKTGMAVNSSGNTSEYRGIYETIA